MPCRKVCTLYLIYYYQVYIIHLSQKKEYIIHSVSPKREKCRIHHVPFVKNEKLNLFHYLSHFCYYLCVLLHFFVLFMALLYYFN